MVIVIVYKNTIFKHNLIFNESIAQNYIIKHINCIVFLMVINQYINIKKLLYGKKNTLGEISND